MNKQLYIAVYIDHFFIFSLDIARPEEAQQKLQVRLKMTNSGDISHYLGMQVDHIVGERITLYQSTYLKKILDRFKMTECKPACISKDLGVANSLLPYDGNADKKKIK